MPYRITITDAATNRADLISFHCTIEKETEPGVWSPVENVPADIRIPARSILAILKRDVDDATKRQELLLLFKSHARSLDIIVADNTIDSLEALLPSGWPVTVNL